MPASHPGECEHAAPGSLCDCDCAGARHAVARNSGRPAAGAVSRRAQRAAARDGRASLVTRASVPGGPGRGPAGKPAQPSSADFVRWARIARSSPGTSTAREPLAGYGDRLHLEDQSPLAHQHLSELEKIPAAWHNEVNHHMSGHPGAGIFVGDKAMPDLDSMQAYKGVQPRGWPPGSTWDTVPGAWASAPYARLILGGGGHGHGSTTLAGHEFGHAADDAAGEALSGVVGHHASWLPEYAALYNRLYVTRGLKQYFRQPNGAGHTESWAEGFAAYTDGLATGTETDKIRGVFGCDPVLAADLVTYYRGVQQALVKAQRKRSAGGRP